MPITNHKTIKKRQRINNSILFAWKKMIGKCAFSNAQTIRQWCFGRVKSVENKTITFIDDETGETWTDNFKNCYPTKRNEDFFREKQAEFLNSYQCQ